MTYQVLARKYRPPTFEGVVAQAHVTRTLQNAVRNGRVGSGYLFCGPRGTGKTTTARILAKALNCVNGPTPEPCGVCPACRDITGGNSLDVLEIDAASNTGVDDVRALRERINLTPAGGKKKIYIIDEVHRLSGAAFDALLKTLEEPPEHVKFIFATTEPTKVPETILSRTQRFDFKRVSALDLAQHLQHIAEQEGMAISESAVALLARRGDGSVRDALSLLDQVAAFAGETIGETDVVEALGLVDRQTLFDFTGAVAAQDAPAALRLANGIIEAGIDVEDFFAEALDHLRILMILLTDRESGDLLNLSAEEREAYLRQADSFRVGDVIRLMKMVGDGRRDLKDGLDERLVLQVAAVKMAAMEATVQFEEVLSHLRQNPPAASGTADLFGNPAKKKDPDRPPEPRGGVSAPPTPPIDPQRTLDLAAVRAGWEGFLAELRQRKAMLSSQLAMATLVEVKDNELAVVFGAGGTMPLQIVTRTENLHVITTALREHYRAPLRIKFSLDPRRQGPGPTEEKRGLDRAQIEKLIADSPRIRRLLDLVEGEVIGVRKVT
ncbi:MAG TPA: DNA polymerase III subunit gamma/tau [candidate division Zixibacteria bacterium]|nr:DNA polymerase III subunit gamma/tau [candidate division Zixibacteria bacterium]